MENIKYTEKNPEFRKVQGLVGDASFYCTSEIMCTKPWYQ